MSSGPPTTKFVNKPVATFTVSDAEKLKKENKAWMVVTHLELETWHKEAIRKSVGEYGIGVVFVPLGGEEEEEELPVLKPLDPRTMTSFGDLGAVKKRQERTLDEEIVLKADGEGNVEEIIEDIVSGVREIMET
jgi:hypothetical protein